MEANPAALGTSAGARPSALAKARSLASSTWALGAFVFCLTWGGGLASPQTISIDDSLHAGLNMAAAQGLEFGPDIVFTYGPLGFLKSYLVYYEWTARLATLYGIGLHFALSVSLVWAMRRNFPAIVAVVVALVAAALMRGDLGTVYVRADAGVIVLTLIWGLAALTPGAPSWVARIVLYGGGPFAAIEVLTKLNTGLIVLAIVVIAAFAMEGNRRRNLATLALTFGVPLVGLWFASGQGLDSVASFLSGSREVISGYSTGARLDWAVRDYDYVLIPLIAVAAAAIAWVSSRGSPTGRRLAILAILAIVTFTAAKGGLVSHDEFHMATFFGTMLGLVVAFRLPDRKAVRAGALVVSVGIIAAASTTFTTDYPLTDPVENLRNAGSTVAAVVDDDRLAREVAANRESLAAGHDLDPRSLELLEGHTVHVDPSETSAAWAYDLDWNPLPVYQPYVAWTEELDRRNAEAVAAASGPERILRQNLNALGRFPAYESPAAMLEMLCNFEPLRTTSSWQVLGRIPDRCGEPRLLRRVETTYGDPVAVPQAPPDSIVFARVEGIQVAGLERLRALLHRARGREVSFRNSEGVPPSTIEGTSMRDEYIFIPETAGNGLLLRAPADVDSPDPFRLAPNADTLGFLLDRGPSDDPLEVEFFAMAVEPAGR
jgi:hypothetical protein